MTDQRKTIAMIGSFMLFIGPFLPFMSAPLLGDVTYFRNGTGDGAIVFALAFASILIVLFEKYMLLLATAIGSGLTIIYTAVTLASKLNELQSSYTSHTVGAAEIENLARTAYSFIQIQWGMPFMLIGVMLLLYASIESQKKNKLTTSCPHCGEAIPIGQAQCNHCKNPIVWIKDRARKPTRDASSGNQLPEREKA